MARHNGNINKHKRFSLEIFNIEDGQWHLHNDKFITLKEIATFLKISYMGAVNVKLFRSKRLCKKYKIY